MYLSYKTYNKREHDRLQAAFRASDRINMGKATIVRLLEYYRKVYPYDCHVSGRR